MKRRYIAELLILALLSGLFYGMPQTGKADTPPLVTNSKIVYPISLKTGKDAAGRLIFPDSNFFQYIKTEKFQTGSYSGYKFDLDENGSLSKEECELVRVISVSGEKNISSVKGIEAFPKLRELYCSNSNISELDLSNNPRLQILACSDNKLTSLDVSVCPLLKELRVSGCMLTNLNLSKNPELNFLTCLYQERDAYEYIEDGKYKVSLKDWDKNMDVTKVSELKIDGAGGDGINSGYEADTGIIYCSDEMQQISYQYDFSFAGIDGVSVDKVMNVTLNVKTGFRQEYATNGGSRILPSYIEAGKKDLEPEKPKRNGYRLSGWYTTADCKQDSRWSFGTEITQNMLLYAGWEKKTYKVCYDAKGGAMTLKEKAGVTDWWTANLIPTGKAAPSKIGYYLEGWLTESGKLITYKNAASVSYGQAVKEDEKDSTTLSAKWAPKSGYKLRFGKSVSGNKAKVEDFPNDNLSGKINWDSKNYLDWDEEPEIPGYDFLGWYTAKSGGKLVTEDTPYREIYASQYKGDSTGNIPVLYARFAKKKYTIYYNESGGSKVKDRSGVLWGSANLLPKEKTKRKNYIFAGWKYGGKKITKKTNLTSICDGYEDYIILKAVWYKKYEKKGKKFWRYGCRYQVVQSNKKGNKVSLIKVKKGKKKLTLRNKVFYNGKNFVLKKIKKGSLKKVKKVVLKMPKKQKRKYAKMVRKAGGKTSLH